MMMITWRSPTIRIDAAVPPPFEYIRCVFPSTIVPRPGVHRPAFRPSYPAPDSLWQP